LTILKAYRPGDGKTKVLTRCICGNEKEYDYQLLAIGHTKSCGCKSRELNSIAHKKENKYNHDIYMKWKQMYYRCYNDKNPQYKYYGERGITICDEWKDDYYAFEKWAFSTGYQKGLSIDRIDNNKGYSPDNCRWATIKEQNRNKSDTTYITFHNKKVVLATICEDLGLNLKRIKRLLNNNKDILPILEQRFQFLDCLSKL